MKKEFSKFQIATLKRVAQSVYPLVRIKEKLLRKVEECNQELASLQTQIEGFQTPIREMTGGYSTEDLIVREVVDTGKVDKQGNPIKTTSYKLKYPETIVPVEAENEEESVDTSTVNEEDSQTVVNNADTTSADNDPWSNI